MGISFACIMDEADQTKKTKVNNPFSPQPKVRKRKYFGERVVADGHETFIRRPKSSSKNTD